MTINPNSATISVLAGAGGDDAKNWAQMLLRMYARYADRKNWKRESINDSTIEVKGGGAYERLKGSQACIVWSAFLPLMPRASATLRSLSLRFSPNFRKWKRHTYRYRRRI